MSFLSGFSGALPLPRPHHAVPAAERQGAPVDSSERGAGDLSPAPGSGLLAATPGLLPGGYCDAAPLPAAGGGVHRPKEPQVRHEVAVRDLGVRHGGPSFPPLLSNHYCPQICDKGSWQEGSQSSLLLYDITDALTSDCNQPDGCPGLD